MKRKLNALELRRLREGGHEDPHQQPESANKKRSPTKGGGGGVGSPKRARVVRSYGSSVARKEDPREHQNLNREEIALMFMEVSEKIDRCFDFDLQKWLGRYETLREKEETNFPEAAMLVMSSAQIYGRKVDYLEEIILHMDHDQKGRDEGTETDQKESKPAGRKRAARFQPQSLSDCFSDLDFSFVDKKTAPIGSLVTKLERVTVDRRNKFQQMQEFCNELRTMPSKQRRQEILNRLRDEANIAPILSSHTAARKNQILDLESGETIGTRYDYQIFLNFIDVKTGSLKPEHDLKKFFQRCDVIDYLFEQHEYEREHCERAGKEAPEKVFPLKPREFKIYMPPDYLKNKYRIDIDDTADFDNELHKARSSNYRRDPILELMQSKFADRGKDAELWATMETSTEEASFSNVLSSTAIDQSPSSESSIEVPAEESDSTPFDDSGHLDDSQNTEPDNSATESTQPPHDPSRSIIISIISEHDRGEFSKSKESSPEPELMALENQTIDGATANQDPSGQQWPSRLSMEDEGIGVDRESLGKQTPSDLARTPSIDKLSECGMPSDSSTAAPTAFGSGMVVMAVGGAPMRTISLKPALLERNLLKIPECHLRKHLLFSLPPEYKKMKMDLVRKTSDRTKDMFTLTLYSLSPPRGGAKNPAGLRRASTPELEDFHGFDEYADILQGPNGTGLYSLAPLSDGQRSNVSRPCSPESDFLGFENSADSRPNTDIANFADFDHNNRDEANISQNPVPEPEKEQAVASMPEPEKTQPASQQSTPTRTMSRDSGISDDQNDQALRGSRSKEGTPEPSSVASVPVPEEPSATTTESDQNSALTSEKFIQSMAEAKELIEKVNNWHRKLRPILIESEKRNHFDIHAYGTEIIDSFGPEESTATETPAINFAQVMENKQEDFTARYFLSMLMLANTNNVQIVTKNQDPQRLTAKEDIELRLLSRKRHHQEMESMGERIPCDNTPAVSASKSSRGKKRKRLVEEDEGLEREDEGDLSGIQRLRDDGAGDDDEPDHNFLERILRIYPDINSEETKRKRIAFRRGMRQCAYGLSSDGAEPPEEACVEESSVPPPQPPPPPEEPEQITPEQDDPDEILSVDLQTNEAIMAPMMVDQDPCCSKSLISASESGYGSMIGASDC
ncbi:uncharacterized protein Cap-H2 [Ochlerotatus camptorhynchus]|uniref:uncharacterized protein Cap-H2 n=1 Tax=Ochlerotatus camptorhynchus TaxID=644619 RepID=UPI0031E37934